MLRCAKQIHGTQKTRKISHISVDCSAKRCIVRVCVYVGVCVCGCVCQWVWHSYVYSYIQCRSLILHHLMCSEVHPKKLCSMHSCRGFHHVEWGYILSTVRGKEIDKGVFSNCESVVKNRYLNVPNRLYSNFNQFSSNLTSLCQF